MKQYPLGLSLLAMAAIAPSSPVRAGVSPVPGGAAPAGFVLFADHDLRTKGLRAHGGTIAVNRGDLTAIHGALMAPQSDVVANAVRLDRRSKCNLLLANQVTGTAAGCTNPQAFTSPLVADFAAACGLPSAFPSCTASAPVVVEKRQPKTLPPGVYGELRLRDDATIHLSNGTYVFCRVGTGRRAKVLTAASTIIQVTGDVRLGNNTTIAPDGAASTDEAILQVTGRVVHFARQSRVQARLCAPTAALSLAEGGVHHGCFAARSILVSRADVTPCAAASSSSTSTTTTTSSTSTTTAR